MKSRTTALSKSESSAALLRDTPEPLRLSLGECAGVNLALVGCGGTGSHLASGLGALACELRERKGLNVALVFVDPDRVESKNVGRQLFTASEVGQYKAHVLAQRITAAYRIPVDALTEPLAAEHLRGAPFRILNLVIGAVDNDAARRVIHHAVSAANGQVWVIDSGNEQYSGQVFLGNTATHSQMRHSVELGMTRRLPSPYLIGPDLIRPKRKQKARPMSCAESTASGEQGLMVNRMMAAWTLCLLHDFLIARDVHYFGVSVDLKFGGVRSYPMDLPTLCETTGLKPDELMAR